MTAATLRSATLSDVEQLVALRVDLLRAIGALTDDHDDFAVRSATWAYFVETLRSGIAYTRVATTPAGVIGCCTLVPVLWPPNPRNLTGREAFLANLHVYADHRDHDILESLLKACIEDGQAWGCRRIWAFDVLPDTVRSLEQLGFQSAAAGLMLDT